MTSFQCTKCKVCQRRKTMSEAFNHSSTCCDDCFTPPEEKTRIEEQPSRRSSRIWATDRAWASYNRKSPKAKQLYKQYLISNS